MIATAEEVASVDRFVRQQDLVPAEKLQELQVTIIGVGAIGRQVALQLAAMGVRKLQLVDHDLVNATNITTQGYWASDMGLPKVCALRTAVGLLDAQIEVDAEEQKYRPQLDVGGVVFCCVDSIATRAAIWRSLAGRVQCWADGRMMGETIRVLIAADDVGRDHYPKTLFSEQEAQPGRCTARSTIYTANIASALMVHQFTRWLRGLAVDCDTTVDLLAGDLVVAND